MKYDIPSSAVIAVGERLRHGYERGRIERAFPWGMGMFAMLFVVLNTSRPAVTAFFWALGTGLLVFWALWRGLVWEQGVRRGCMWGFAAGVATFVAGQTQDTCALGQCHNTTCMYVCAIAGSVAALGLVQAAFRSHSPLRYLIGGAAATLTLGAAGCSCVGVPGMLWLLAAFAAALGTTAPLYALRFNRAA